MTKHSRCQLQHSYAFIQIFSTFQAQSEPWKIALKLATWVSCPHLWVFCFVIYLFTRKNPKPVSCLYTHCRRVCNEILKTLVDRKSLIILFDFCVKFNLFDLFTTIFLLVFRVLAFSISESCVLSFLLKHFLFLTQKKTILFVCSDNEIQFNKLMAWNIKAPKIYLLFMSTTIGKTTREIICNVCESINSW